MKSYKRLFARGITYGYRSLYIWEKRRKKLSWKWTFFFIDQERASRIISQLDERIDLVTTAIKKQYKVGPVAGSMASASLVELVCSNTLCHSHKRKQSLVVTKRDYYPLKYECSWCGSPLYTAEDIKIDTMLDELNILLPNE